MRLLSKTCWLGLVIVLGLSTWTAAPGQAPEKKLPVPDRKAEAEAVDIMMFVFGEDLAKVKGAEPLTYLALKLREEARASLKDPANRYVLYREARDVAARAGNAQLALDTVDEMAHYFNVNALEMKAASLTKAASVDLSKDYRFPPKVIAEEDLKKAYAALVAMALPLIHESVEADNFDLAISLGKVALKAANDSKDESLQVVVAKRNEDVLAVQKSFARTQAFIDRLQKNAKDEEANFELGKYYIVLKGRWEKGLPYLAKGVDASLKTLAGTDLAGPKTAHTKLALADGWWNQAAKEKDKSLAQIALLLRAAHWYAEAVEDLSGLNRTKAIRRMDVVKAKLTGTNAEVPSGPVGAIKTFVGHTDDVKNVAFAPEGRHAVSGSSDYTVRIWDLASGKEEKVLKGHTKQVWSVAFHLSNRQVLSASWDTTVRLWDVKSGNEIRRFSHRLDVNALALSRDGKTMLTGSDDHNVYLWDVQTGEEIRRFSGHTNFVYCVAFSPDGRLFASGGVDKSVRVGELANGALVRVFEGSTGSVTNVAFAADSRTIFSCGDGAAHQWELATGKELRRFEHKNKLGTISNVLSLVVSNDGRRLYTGGDDKSIRAWDVLSGKELYSFEGHTDTVTSLALSLDGYRLLSGSLDRTMRLWGLPSR